MDSLVTSNVDGFGEKTSYFRKAVMLNQYSKNYCSIMEFYDLFWGGREGSLDVCNIVVM
jgi:hypothetical protein